MKSYLIDGNNLMLKLKRTASIWTQSKQASRELLISILMESRDLQKASLKVFFDGPENEKIASGKIKLHYSNKRTADYFIRKDIELSKNARQSIVVSSDHEIVNLAKACLFSVVSSEDFAQSLDKRSSSNDEETKINSLKNENNEFYQLLSRSKKPE